MSQFWDSPLKYLRGMGEQRADLLAKELGIYTYRDLVQYYPLRHEDRTQHYALSMLTPEMQSVVIKGQILRFETIGEGSKKRLVATFSDGTGFVDLIWFQGIQWQLKSLKMGLDYLVFGKPEFFGGRYSLVHPEMEVLESLEAQTGYLQPVYSLTEKLKHKFISSKTLSKIIRQLLEIAQPHFSETLSPHIVHKYRLLSRGEAMMQIHFPQSAQMLQQAKNRLKFEELFFLQLKLLKQQLFKKTFYRGQVFNTAALLTEFYEHHLPFTLTNAQKRVVREVYKDMASGRQMNRLVQGDVGSGKTMVAFLAMLIAVGGGAQACLVAPTEILAEQHYQGLKEYADKLNLTIELLTGTTPNRDRRVMHERLMNGNLKILIGTHALFEDKVQFENLGLCVIDEQHRFGVAQRAKLWEKNPETPPHILVMTATPIPRTLAMTLYGDLDVSVIDELPAGRKPIITAHRYDSHRLRVFGFLREQIAQGRQVYIVYPVIESDKLTYKTLMDGYESIARAFPEYHLSIVHGQMSSKDKDFEMQRFKRGETHIMVATTVIEVGVNVPNATVMVIENAERFGLSQLHQLRGRVGRGGEQSYCILMTDVKLSREAKKRIETMVETTDGFRISEVDLQLRGPGDLMGTQQSGVLDLVMADLARDQHILQEARHTAQELLEADPYLENPANTAIKNQLQRTLKEQSYWSRIS